LDDLQASRVTPRSLPRIACKREQSASAATVPSWHRSTIHRGGMTSRRWSLRAGSDSPCTSHTQPCPHLRRSSASITLRQKRNRRTAAPLRMGGPALEPGTSCLYLGCDRLWQRVAVDGNAHTVPSRPGAEWRHLTINGKAVLLPYPAPARQCASRRATEEMSTGTEKCTGFGNRKVLHLIVCEISTR
jgi:hypothetical protein